MILTIKRRQIHKHLVDNKLIETKSQSGLRIKQSAQTIISNKDNNTEEGAEILF